MKISSALKAGSPLFAAAFIAVMPAGASAQTLQMWVRESAADAGDMTGARIERCLAPFDIDVDFRLGNRVGVVFNSLRALLRQISGDLIGIGQASVGFDRIKIDSWNSVLCADGFERQWVLCRYRLDIDVQIKGCLALTSELVVVRKRIHYAASAKDLAGMPVTVSSGSPDIESV